MSWIVNCLLIHFVYEFEVKKSLKEVQTPWLGKSVSQSVNK